MAFETLTTSELSVVVGDNEPGTGAHSVHRAGYNGVWSLTSTHAPENCFSPAVAGLNLEHLMDDLFMTDEGGEIFEPRAHPMQLKRTADNAVRLSQEPSPLTGVSSETVITVREPFFIDFEFRATLTRPPRSGRSFGFFWASYMRSPETPALQFLDPEGIWCCLSPDGHGDDSGNTVCYATVEPRWGNPELAYRSGSLTQSFSQRRFGLPLMFGRPGKGDMLFAQMFDQREPVRLCMSPTGGGREEGARVNNPAWDFQYIVDDAAEGTTCHLRSRVIYKPFVDRDEVERLYAEWDVDHGVDHDG